MLELPVPGPNLALLSPGAISYTPTTPTPPALRAEPRHFREHSTKSVHDVTCTAPPHCSPLGIIAFQDLLLLAWWSVVPYTDRVFFEATRNPEHEEHEEYLEWVGGSFDPEAFDLAEVNKERPKGVR